MINIRAEALVSDNSLLRLFAKSDLLWDYMQNNPDIYCTSIADYLGSVGLIREGRHAVLSSAEIRKKERDRMLLYDRTGELWAISTVESLPVRFLDAMSGFAISAKLSMVDEGRRLEDIWLYRKEGKDHIDDFSSLENIKAYRDQALRHSHHQAHGMSMLRTPWAQYL